jgi:hypothetical protein
MKKNDFELKDKLFYRRDALIPRESLEIVAAATTRAFDSYTE